MIDATGMTLQAWLGVFLASGTAIVLAGTVLARSGDEIARRTGLSGLFVGMLLVAGATSLPEILTDMSAAAAGAPDLAVGDLMGSSMANMAILAVVDLVGRRHVWSGVGLGHARVAALAIGLTAAAVLSILVPPGLAIAWLGVETVIIACAYAGAVAWIWRARDGEDVEAPIGAVRAVATPEPFSAGRLLQSDLAKFFAAALVILVAAPVVAISGKGIADESGLGQTFVGASLLAVATSLPELAASMAAVRLGAFDLAVGNLFGSNAFNMTVLVAADAAYVDGPILAAVSPAQVVAGVAAILLMAIALAAIVHGSRTRVARLEPDAVLLLAMYVLSLGAVWAASSRS